MGFFKLSVLDALDNCHFRGLLPTFFLSFFFMFLSCTSALAFSITAHSQDAVDWRTLFPVFLPSFSCPSVLQSALHRCTCVQHSCPFMELWSLTSTLHGALLSLLEPCAMQSSLLHFSSSIGLLAVLLTVLLSVYLYLPFLTHFTLLSKSWGQCAPPKHWYIYITTQHHISEDFSLFIHHHQNLMCHIIVISLLLI